jgi:hypothetical protein
VLTSFLVVDTYVPAADDTFNLRLDAWSLALDQRAFGPRKLLVAFADADGSFRGLAFTDRTEPIEDALAACISYLGRGAAAAIAFNDEPVDKDKPPGTYFHFFTRMRQLADRRGLRLIDWFACDDDLFRSMSPMAAGSEEWWYGGE